MGRRAMKESEKAMTPLSDDFLADLNLSTKLNDLAEQARRLPEADGKHRSGLCAIRDACNVLIWKGAEEDLEESSEYMQKLREDLKEKIRLAGD